ncbi:hypothetical protein [Sphaerisporangium sp. TRM90804]|uniref:hypothetical protein n=1 Tax=Sphaerisporangium sp. TRM90804 TaxID=3031113 RepID=UPI002449BA07|nr:hypothetical protein [Sphaerisporangium sp. TRM90804]MDH2424610.1 hypothetical protein [Sphaerisporangium sp. TRM90804]
MKMVALTLSHPAERKGDITPSGLVDLIWVHTSIDDRLEHIHARAWPGGIDVVFFLAVTSSALASTRAGAISLRAISSAPALRGWSAEFAGGQTTDLVGSSS